VSVRAVTAISHTDDNFICATLDWWPRDKCNYGMCPWYDSSILNLVRMPNLMRRTCSELLKSFTHLQSY
jgi:heparanase 1